MRPVVRVAMWSGPRNVSTALMRSFGSRADAIVCDEPRSASLVTTAGLMSTHTIFTHDGSMFPTPMPCSIVESARTRPTPSIADAYRSCASRRSMIVSGSGPSSRMLPASTKSTPCRMHSYMTPDFNTP